MAKHGTARDDRRPTVGELRTLRGKNDANQASSRADALDRLIHERLRLGIVSALAVNDSLSFSDLKKLMKTTDGNLSVHARKLEEAGYITCEKSFKGRTPLTEYSITTDGRAEIGKYLDHMEALIKAMKKV